MKTHTQDFKENIKLFGRELSSKVTYTLGGQTIELGNENLNSVSPHYEGAILKSVMKQLDVDCDREIPEGTEINYQFGVKVRDMKNIFVPTLTADGTNISHPNNTPTLNADEYSLVASGTDMRIGEVTNQGVVYSGSKGTLYEVADADTIYLYCTNSTFNKNYITWYDENKVSLGYNAINNSKTNGKTVPANAKYFSIRFGYSPAVSGTTYKTKVMVSREPITEYETYGTTPYDYVNFGNYIVKDVEKQEDSNSWRMTCYDAMLNSMKDYESVGVTYPTTVRNYIIAICNYLGLEFANETDIFANCDKVIPNEMYLDSEGNSLGYTFRDVLDQLAEVTASTICINEDTNKLEIRYINELGTVTTKSGTIIEIDDNKSAKLDDFQVNGNTYQETYSGKNLLELPNTQTINGITFTKNNDGTFNLSGTATSNADFIVEKELDYISTGYYTASVENTGYQIQIAFYNNNSWLSTPFNKLRQEQTTTSNVTSIPSNANKVRLVIRVSNGVTIDLQNEKAQLEKGSTATDYEKYVGGIPSPNPDYPQNVETVTGRQDIYECGKNLFDINSITIGKTLNTGTGLEQNSDNNHAISNFIQVDNTQPYMLSGILGTATLSEIYIFYYDANNEYIGATINRGTGDLGELEYNIRSYTGYSRAKYIRIRIDDLNNLNNLQLEKGNIKTNYEPYQGTTYEINLGKNLFDKNILQQGGLDLGSSGGETVSSNRIRTNFIEVQPNTSYVISNVDTIINQCGIGLYKSNNSYDSAHKINSGSWNDIPKTFTTQSDTKYIRLVFRNSNNNDITPTENYKIQLEKGSIPTLYSKYKTPIELRGLGNYKDGIKKSTGKNLFDGQIEIGGLDINTGLPVDNNTRTRSKNFIKVKPNTTYTITRKVGEHRWVLGYKADGQVISDGTISGNPTGLIHLEPSDYTGTFTTTATTEYIKWYDTNTTSLTQQVQIEPGSTPTDLEPYGVGKWFISRKICINKADGNNSDNISYVSGNSDANYSQFNITKNKANWTNFNTDTKNLCKSNYFAYYSGATASGKTQSGFTLWNNGGTNFVFSFPTSMVTTGSEAASFRTWLTTHVVYAYGVAQFTSYEDINDSELIAQLNAIELYEGSNTISSISAGTNGELKISYFSDFETIDEEYLKDINVNFGEQYGTINTIVLSRSAGSDNIYYPEILPENPVEIKISDNQIMNGDDRDTYMPDIYYRLNGLQYYLNDFSSTGITYFNLCDKYRVKIYDNVYPCIMFNDEVNVTQGLEENIYTEMPDEAETDYKTADTTDRRINQTTLQVNKQEGIIRGLVTTVETDSGRIDAVETTVTSQSAQINIIQTNINKDTGDIESVKTLKGYTFDDQGLEISSDEDEFSSLLSNTGAYYKVDGKTVSQITKDNTITKDMVLYGRYYYGVDVNLDVENFTKDDAMFVAEKYTDGNSEEGFGHFYNGLGG